MKNKLIALSAIAVGGTLLASCGGLKQRGQYTRFMGTISQHAEIQAYATLRAARNALDGVSKENFWKTGYTDADDSDCKLDDPAFMITDVENGDQKNFLAKNVAVTAENKSKYADATAIAAGVKQLKLETHPKKTVFYDLYNANDNFLSNTYQPLLEKYAPLLNLELKFVGGNGTDESSIVDNLDLTCDAYCFNIVKTDNAGSYTARLNNDENKNKPLIWFNRQPSNSSTGEITKEAMNFNEHTYYVGFDAAGGGDVQGQMILDFLKANAAKVDIAPEGKTDSGEPLPADKIIKYYLCIGDAAHNDSIARTKGIRRALGTLKDDSADPGVKQEGKFTASDGTEYKVIEAQAAEMKAGASTWDANTAAETTSTWRSANPEECELVISNNDGMGMAVYNKWAKAVGIPVFGYDANTDAVQAI